MLSEKLMGIVLDPAEVEKMRMALLMGRLRIVYEAFQRRQLWFILACRWYIPGSIAYWLAMRGPRRWLPKLKPKLWETELI